MPVSTCDHELNGVGVGKLGHLGRAEVRGERVIGPELQRREIDRESRFVLAVLVDAILQAQCKLTQCARMVDGLRRQPEDREPGRFRNTEIEREFLLVLQQRLVRASFGFFAQTLLSRLSPSRPPPLRRRWASSSASRC